MSTYGSRTVPLDYWGTKQSGPTTSTFYAVSARVRLLLCNLVDHFLQQGVRSPHQPSPGPPRTGMIRMGRFQPYEVSRTRPNEHRNTEAGPSTPVPLPLPYVGPPTPKPSGGISETPADAKKNQSDTEGDKGPVSKFYCSHIPHVTEWSSGVRPPRRLGALAVKDDLARTECGRRKLLTSCAPGCSNRRAS